MARSHLFTQVSVSHLYACFLAHRLFTPIRLPGQSAKCESGCINNNNNDNSNNDNNNNDSNNDNNIIDNNNSNDNNIIIVLIIMIIMIIMIIVSMIMKGPAYCNHYSCDHTCCLVDLVVFNTCRCRFEAICDYSCSGHSLLVL